jgi:hypothetical protein
VRKRLYPVLDANEDVTYTSEVVASANARTTSTRAR